MKNRNGFVSNSSSSSFIIKLKHLTAEQLIKIQNHAELENVEHGDQWNIVIDEKTIECYTSMDNFDMEEYLLEIGVKPKRIKSGGY